MYSYELVRMPDASYRKSLNKLLGLFRALVGDKMKPFSDFNKQINILENRNLTILDKEAANFALRNYGYYEIV